GAAGQPRALLGRPGSQARAAPAGGGADRADGARALQLGARREALLRGHDHAARRRREADRDKPREPRADDLPDAPRPDRARARLRDRSFASLPDEPRADEGRGPDEEAEEGGRQAMKICILSCSRHSYSTRRLREACLVRGHTVRVLDTLRFTMAVEAGKPQLLYRDKPL